MSAKQKLKVVLCWHMHQPEYCDLITGEYQLPWTYLHVIKDYTDMAAHLESVPAARAVVNFAPILLEQISDYAGQVQGFLRDGKAIRDPLLAAVVSPAMPASAEQRIALIKACRRANETRVLRRFEPYRKLVEKAAWFEEHPAYMADQFLVDLVVWYHLVWLGETVRRSNLLVKKLHDKAGGYTMQDRSELMTLLGELLSGILRRYTALAEQGRVELSVSPYAHPILPLLLDLRSAREAMPQADLPKVESYPGGEERVRWHLREAVNTFEQYFGFKPQGCWPSEGSISRSLLPLLDEYGFLWCASGETVLYNSLARSGIDEHAGREEMLYRPFRLEDTKVQCFFRDDSLSDLIGFTYSEWHADDAVANLVHHLETIGAGIKDPSNSVVSIILDGENAWEYFPQNGRPFLRALYRILSANSSIECLTVSEALQQHGRAETLGRLAAGSWINANFDIWIGAEEDNVAWDHLAEARECFDAHEKAVSPENRALALEELLIAEGSDWCWWYGPEHPTANAQDFDALYRSHLSNVYRTLGHRPPEALVQPIVRFRVRVLSAPPEAVVSPMIDGVITNYFEWMGAGYYNPLYRGTVMQGGPPLLRQLYYGRNRESFFLRMDFYSMPDLSSGKVQLRIAFRDTSYPSVAVYLATPGPDQKPICEVRAERESLSQPLALAEAALDKILEVKLSLAALGMDPMQPFDFRVTLWEQDLPRETFPLEGWLTLAVFAEE